MVILSIGSVVRRSRWVESEVLVTHGFWADLPTPIFALAPMANVTDAAFRRMFATYGKPTVLWTEFVSVEGLCSAGRERLLPDLWFTEAERPIVAQIFGTHPEQFEQTAGLMAELGFDGIDINMGCPDKNVEKQGAGAALIKNPELAREIIRATKRGARGLPVSVKTRIGHARPQIDEWLPVLLGEDLAALTVHLRTRKEMSDVPAHWELAPTIATLRDQLAPQTKLLGNGDINSLDEAEVKIRDTGFDGVMIGRGAFGSPWFFSGTVPEPVTRLNYLIEHAELFEQLYHSDQGKDQGKLKNFEVMKKHFKAYLAGIEGTRDLRLQLMSVENATELRALIEGFIREN